MLELFVLGGLLILSLLIAVWVWIISVIRSNFRDDRIKELKKENMELKRQLREEAERLKQHYEQLLKDAAVRNTVMLALYNAWKNGSLSSCYREGGEPAVLADGTVLCKKARDEESYVIKVENDATTV